MSTLFVDKSGCDLDVESGRIVMRQNGERGGTWPLALIGRVVANRGTRVSGRLVAALSAAGIGLMFDGGQLLVPAGDDGACRRRPGAAACAICPVGRLGRPSPAGRRADRCPP